jgi:hypothetical protein
VNELQALVLDRALEAVKIDETDGSWRHRLEDFSAPTPKS